MTDSAASRSPTGPLRVLLATGLSFAAGLAVAWGIYRHTHPEPDLLDPDTSAILGEAERKYFEALAAFKKQSGGGGAYVNRRELLLGRVMTEMRGENGTALYNINICDLYRKAWKKATGRDLDGTVLEIGPGANLGTGLILAMEGVRKYYGLDIYQDPDLYAPPTYERARDLLQFVAPERIRAPLEQLLTVREGKVEFQREKIEYLHPRQSYDIPLPEGSLDFAFSHATLEHVADPRRTMAALRRVIRPGGLTAHQIDLRDHRNDFKTPLEFLKVDAAAWGREYEAPDKAHLFMNRWRLGDFRKAFEEAGFELLSVEVNLRTEVGEALRASLHADFRSHSLEDLSALGVFVVARRR